MPIIASTHPSSNLRELSLLVKSKITHIQKLKQGDEKSSVVIKHLDVAVKEFVRKLFNYKHSLVLRRAVSGLWSYHHDNFINDSTFEYADDIDAKSISFERSVNRFLEDLNKILSILKAGGERLHSWCFVHNLADNPSIVELLKTTFSNAAEDIVKGVISSSVFLAAGFSFFLREEKGEPAFDVLRAAMSEVASCSRIAAFELDKLKETNVQSMLSNAANRLESF